MDFLQGNIVVQIILLVVGLALIGYFGYRAIRDRRAKAATKKRNGGTNSKNTGLRR